MSETKKKKKKPKCFFPRSTEMGYSRREKFVLSVGVFFGLRNQRGDKQCFRLAEPHFPGKSDSFTPNKLLPATNDIEGDITCSSWAASPPPPSRCHPRCNHWHNWPRASVSPLLPHPKARSSVTCETMPKLQKLKMQLHGVDILLAEAQLAEPIRLPPQTGLLL